jgi:hypothetical protein
MGIIGQTIVLTWLVNNTKSVLAAIVFHALLPVALTWVLAVALTKRFSKETLTGIEQEAA